MKFLAVFVALLAVACGYQTTWNINSISEAIQNPSTSPEMLPYLNAALDQLMNDLVLGSAGASEVTINTGAMDLSLWTIHELSDAIQDPATDPMLQAYLEHALNIMMDNIHNGNYHETIVVATPSGLLNVETPVSPVSVVSPVADTSANRPIVQIIVKVNNQAVPVTPEAVVLPAPVAPEVVPEAVVLPAPVLPEVVVPEPVVLPAPIAPEVVPEAVVLPAPVMPEVVIPEPVVLPAPVHPEIAVNPIDVIAVNPISVTNPIEVNPVDVIAISPEEINPVDIISPIPVTGSGVHVVGPIV